MNPTYAVGVIDDVDEAENLGKAMEKRFGIDSLTILLATNMSLEIADTKTFAIEGKQITLAATSVPDFDPKGWWTKGETNMIGSNERKY